MAGILKMPDIITEEQFHRMVDGHNLPRAEYEAARKHFELSCDEAFLASLVDWESYAVMAFQRLRGNPLLCR